MLSTHQLYVPTHHDVIKFVFFNDIPFSIHLWYLPAYINVLVIAFFIDKYKLWNISFYFIIPLLLIGIIIRYSIADICPKEIEYYRNAYFLGLPYFLVGALIKNTPPTQAVLRWQHLEVSFTIAIVVLFVLRYLLLGQDILILAMRELNLLLLIICIFTLFTIHIQPKDNILSYLGNRYSLYIYIFHLLIMSVCEMFVTKLPTNVCNLYMYFHPICVFMLSIALTFALQKLKILKN